MLSLRNIAPTPCCASGLLIAHGVRLHRTLNAQLGRLSHGGRIPLCFHAPIVEKGHILLSKHTLSSHSYEKNEHHHRHPHKSVSSEERVLRSLIGHFQPQSYNNRAVLPIFVALLWQKIHITGLFFHKMKGKFGELVKISYLCHAMPES